MNESDSKRIFKPVKTIKINNNFRCALKFSAFMQALALATKSTVATAAIIAAAAKRLLQTKQRTCECLFGMCVFDIVCLLFFLLSVRRAIAICIQQAEGNGSKFKLCAPRIIKATATLILTS